MVHHGPWPAYRYSIYRAALRARYSGFPGLKVKSSQCRFPGFAPAMNFKEAKVNIEIRSSVAFELFPAWRQRDLLESQESQF